MAQATHEPRGYSTQEANDANKQTWQAFKRKFNEQPMTYGVIFVLIGVLIGGFVFAYSPDWEADNLFSYLTNFGTEALSVLITIFVLDRFQARRAEEQLKKELLADIKYGHNSDAIRAVNRLRLYDVECGWYSSRSSLLARSDLRKANLEKANLTEANLEFCNLFGANLKQVDFFEANLQGADLRKSDLEGSKLWEANLEFSRFMNANLANAVLERANLRGADFSRASLVGANFDEADLRETCFKDADLSRARLPKANLCKVNMERANLQSSDLFEVDFTLANLTDVNLKEANLVATNFRESNLHNANLTRAELFEANFKGANLSGANLRHAQFQGAHFSDDTVLPDGSKYDTSDERGIIQLQRFIDPHYDGPGSFWDPCRQLVGRSRPKYCKGSQ
ncbi:MAG: hypothetical protein CL607_02020 [Anaerolineaceae bacterium]|nr:hypothetical protein [Anaerolineaceae bacterium]